MPVSQLRSGSPSHSYEVQGSGRRGEGGGRNYQRGQLRAETAIEAVHSRSPDTRYTALHQHSSIQVSFIHSFSKSLFACFFIYFFSSFFMSPVKRGALSLEMFSSCHHCPSSLFCALDLHLGLRIEQTQKK